MNLQQRINSNATARSVAFTRLIGSGSDVHISRTNKFSQQYCGKGNSKKLAVTDDTLQTLADSLHSCGVLLLGEQQHVLTMSFAATRLLVNSDELAVVAGAVHLRSPLRRQWFDRVTKIADRVKDDWPSGSSFVEPFIAPQQVRMVVSVTVIQLIDGEPARPAVVVGLIQANNTTIYSGLLRSTFGFTPAEAAVVSELVGGSAIAEIAISRRVSVQTLRQQLKTVFSKVGCGTQHQLVAKVLSHPAVRYPAVV